MRLPCKKDLTAPLLMIPLSSLQLNNRSDDTQGQDRSGQQRAWRAAFDAGALKAAGWLSLLSSDKKLQVNFGFSVLHLHHGLKNNWC